MTHINKNIWDDVAISSKKKCIKGPHIYWYVDEFGAYSLRFENVINNQVKLDDIELEGIKIEYINIKTNFIINLKLINNSNHEIFYFLCCDVIDNFSKYSNIQLSDIKKRLLKWVDLLKKKHLRELTISQQMGLYSELHTIFNFLSNKISLENAILSWKGPEMDKQDFDIGDSLLEIKSYSTTKKKKLSISSIEQLDANHLPLYLLTYELSLNEKGQNINDLLNHFSDKIVEVSFYAQSALFSKLFALGYQNEKDAPQKFTVLSNELYKVENDFPRILKNKISNAISNVKYEIDVEQISSYKCNSENYFK